MIRICLAALIAFQACRPPVSRDFADAAEVSDSLSKTFGSAMVAADDTATDDYEGEDEEISPDLFKKFMGTYTTTVHHFFLDTKDRGIVGTEFTEEWTFDFVRPDSVAIRTALGSDLGKDASLYSQLSMQGGAYSNGAGADTLEIYIGGIMLNGRPVNAEEARLDFDPPFIVYFSGGKLFMETDYVHHTRYPRKPYELHRR